MKRLLVTGSRKLDDVQLVRYAIEEAIAILGVPTRLITLVHGNAVGADLIAAGIGNAIGMLVEPHTAKWSKYGKNAGSIRNTVMVESGADLCIAFPEANSIGTWDCVNKCKNAGIPVKIYQR